MLFAFVKHFHQSGHSGVSKATAVGCSERLERRLVYSFVLTCSPSNFSKVHIGSCNLHKLKLVRVAHNFVESVLETKTLENS